MSVVLCQNYMLNYVLRNDIRINAVPENSINFKNETLYKYEYQQINQINIIVGAAVNHGGFSF